MGKTVTLDKKQEDIPKEALLPSKEANTSVINNENEGAKGLKKVLEKEIKSDEETILPADVEKENEKIVVKDPETKKTFSDDINQKDGQEQTRDRTKEDDTIFTVSESTGAKGLIKILKKEK